MAHTTLRLFVFQEYMEILCSLIYRRFATLSKRINCQKYAPNSQVTNQLIGVT